MEGGFFQSGGQAGGSDGFEQVVECIYLERLDSNFVIAGGKDDERSEFDLIKEVEAGAGGHLDIEQQEIRRKFGDGSLGFFDIGGLTCDFDFRMSREEAAELDAGEALFRILEAKSG